MKKLPIVLCLIFLSLALFNARVYAVFVTDITAFEQFNGSTTFRDNFDGGSGTEPPIGPGGATDYVVEGAFDVGDESGTTLELNTDDGIPDGEGDKIIAAAVSDKRHFFSGGDSRSPYVTGLFDFTSGLPSTPSTFFGIEILNFVDDGSGGIGGDPAIDDEAWLGVIRENNDLLVMWGDESQFQPLGVKNYGPIGVNTTIGLKLEINTSNQVSVWVDYAGSGFVSPPVGWTGINPSNFSTLSFLSGDVYTGGFSAGEELTVVPEPATVALLGIGLAGLGGTYLRRRKNDFSRRAAKNAKKNHKT